MCGLTKCGATLLIAVMLSACATRVSAPVSGPSAAGTPGGSVSQSGATGAEAGYYIVQPGDTLNRIAQQFGHSFHDLAAWNGLTDPNTISVGQSLRVAPPNGVVVTPINIGAPAVGAMPPSAPDGASPPEPATGPKSTPRLQRPFPRQAPRRRSYARRILRRRSMRPRHGYGRRKAKW